MSPPRRQFPCRSCGKTIVADDTTRTISHEAPECEAFSSLMARAPEHTRYVEVLDTTAIPVSPIFKA